MKCWLAGKVAERPLFAVMNAGPLGVQVLVKTLDNMESRTAETEPQSQRQGFRCWVSSQWASVCLTLGRLGVK